MKKVILLSVFASLFVILGAAKYHVAIDITPDPKGISPQELAVDIPPSPTGASSKDELAIDTGPGTKGAPEVGV